MNYVANALPETLAALGRSAQVAVVLPIVCPQRL